MKNRMIKLFVTFALAFVMVFSSVGGVYAQSDGNTRTSDFDHKPSDIRNQKDIEVSLGAEIVTENDVFDVEFLAGESIVDYCFVTDGISIVDEKNRTSEVGFSLQACGEFGRLEVFFNFGDGEYQRQCVYTFTTAGKTFISNSAEDDAWFRALCYKYENGIVTYEEMEAEWGALSRRSVNIVITSTPLNNQAERSSFSTEAESNNELSRATMTVYGTLGWYAKNGSWMPLKFAKVELHRTPVIGSGLIGTTYTDKNGQYSFTFNNSNYDVYVRAYPASTTFDVVAWGLSINDYRAESATVATSGLSSLGINMDILYNTNNNGNKAYYICQSLVVAQRYALEMGMAPSNPVLVAFPHAAVGAMTSFCTGSGIAIVSSDWNVWDNPSHEYGHYVEHTVGTYSSYLFSQLVLGFLVIDFNKANHVANTDHLNDKSTYGKQFAMEFTYSEAWASAFSQIAQDKYKSEYYGFVPDASDYKDHNNWNISTYTPSMTESGEGQEYAVSAFLWDLRVLLGDTSFWDATTRNGTYTLTDLVQWLDLQYPHYVYRAQIGNILGKYQIAPGNFSVSGSYSPSSPPTFSWKVNGSSYYPNSRFRLCFYDYYGNLRYATNDFYFSDAVAKNQLVCTYTLTSGEWASVRASCSGIAYVFVKGYLPTSPTSGPFISNYVPITI